MAIGYTKKTWANGAPPALSAANLQALDDAVEAACDGLDLIKDSASGLITANAGIKFPATQSPSADANTLDDYEEGTWTPDIDALGSGSGRETEVFSAKYVKIGNMVYFYGYFRVKTMGTNASGQTRFKGLPFLNTGGYSACAITYFDNLKASISFAGGAIANNGTYIELYVVPSAGTDVVSGVITTYLKVTSGFMVSGFYTTT